MWHAHFATAWTTGVSVDDALVLEVRDLQLPVNAGRRHLAVTDGAAQCTPTTADADLTVDVAHLGAAFLGEQRFGRLMRAGLAQQHTEGAALRADRMFFSEPLGWCPQEF